ncbi:uncharacterized protein [Dendropsophus ebraccatus]|uniref:uncharacterized protein n=1 Tax=Dendropsophus ebraccatus TaxID=150705 RepID=UPI0038312D5F
MSPPAGQMGKKKNPIKRVLRTLRSLHVSPPEGRPLLATRERSQGSQCLTRLREGLTLQVPITNYRKRKNKVNEVGDSASGEEQIRRLVGRNQFLEACVLIHDEERTGDWYEAVAQEMWRSLTLSLDGDDPQSAMLQAIAQCIQWTKQQKCREGPGWRPQRWAGEVESLLQNDIKKRNPKSDPKQGLDPYLEELEKNVSHMILRTEPFPELLTASYLKCLHVELLSLLTSVVDMNLKYEDHVRLFRWAHKEHRRLCALRAGSEDFDHLLFGNWFLDSGSRIASAGRDAMYRTFVEILHSEIVWISYPKDEVRYYFYDVLEKGNRICKEVEDLGDTLVSKLQSLFWEEFLHLVTRYKIFITEKLGAVGSENGVRAGVRIAKNCCILRNTMNNLRATPQDLELQRIQRLFGECENKGIELILNNLRPQLKEAFRNYFKKNCDQYEGVLRSLKRVLVKGDIHNDQTLVSLIHHRLVVLYIQSFFTWSKKLSHENAGERFSNGSKKLQDFFSDMVLDNRLLPGNPLNSISEMLTTNDRQALSVTTAFFIEEHQDLREEHLSAILNIKENLSSKEKEDLLHLIHRRATTCDQSKLHYFVGIQADDNRWWRCPCCFF